MDCSANDYALGARLKSKRRRKRLSKKAKEKQLIALHHLEMDLWHQKRNLPLVPLEKPYQKGWVRFFCSARRRTTSRYIGIFYRIA